MDNPTINFEASILLNRKQCSADDGILDDLLSSFCEGDYETCLNHEQIRCIWRNYNDDKCETLDSYLRQCVKCYIELNESPEIRQMEVLIHGASALQLFVQNNWIGPPSSNSASDIFKDLFGELIQHSNFLSLDNFNEELKGHALKILNLEGNLYSRIIHPEYLWIAKILLCTCSEIMNCSQTYSWWSLRCVYIHQQMLDEKSPSLRLEAINYINKMAMMESFMTNEKYNLLQVEFHLEAAYSYSYYYEKSGAKEHLNSATKLLGMDISMTGALGKRTYFQEESKAQLKLNIESASSRAYETNYVNTETPTDVMLNDNVRREKIAFENADDNVVIDILPEEQALLLHLFHNKKTTTAMDKLVDEELFAYLSSILSQPKIWAIQMKALILRSELESKHHRSVERSMMQLQEFVNSFNNLHPNVSTRLKLFYCAFLPPFWKLELKLANLLQSLGAVSSALEIYLRLEMWDNVILCYQLLQRKHQAEEIIRQQLNVKETPKLWCTLGDVINEIYCYDRAWELSNHRSARAQKSLGDYYFMKTDYSKCVEYYKKSLELNHLQLSVSSDLGYAAMQIENWEVAASAYRHCVTLEPDNFQAWNNLSNVYLRLKQKTRAWKTLQEALRCDFDNWRIWDNYLVVSADCGAFEEALTAYHRILDLKAKHVDVEILSLLVKTVVEDLPGNDGVGCRQLREKLSQLFGRLTAQVTNSSDVWNLYANVTAASDEKDETVLEKVTQYRQKAQRCSALQVDWEKDSESCEHVVELSLKLADAYLQQRDLCKSDQQKCQLLSSAKLMLKGVTTKLKNYRQSLLNLENVQYLEDFITKLESKLNCVEQ